MFKIELFVLILQIGLSLSSVYDGDEWSEWSEWSPCSRTCDGGVTQQFRRCKSHNGCHGVSIKRKMCNMQPCSDGRDYRGDQCRAFNGINYEGKRRTWEPIEDPDNPCALICRAEGTSQIVRLSPKLRDGTRCRTGALHVCVDGRCEAVGCDLKISSPKKIDACGVCGGDSKSCSQPVYRWDMESQGQCSAKCGGGIQPIRVVCKNSVSGEKVDNFFCNSATKPKSLQQSCNIQPCEPQWESGEWSVCSTTCGGGLQIRKVFCAQEKNGTKIQVADKLCHHIHKPNNQESCSPTPCPHWHAGPWSMCSVTCGKGYKTRNVICRDAINLPSSSCDIRLKPSETKGCSEDPCATSAPTALVTLSRAPTKKRRVKITPSDNTFVIESSSTPSSTSTTTEEENIDVGSNVALVDNSDNYNYPTPEIDNDVYVEEELPREHTLPLIQPYPPMDNAILFDHNALPSEPTKVRVYFACGWLFLSFVAEEWSPCSATCGEGRRTRDVKCKIFLEFSRTIANLPDKECPGPKLSESEPCFATPCHLRDGDGERFSDVHQAALADSDSGSTTMRKTMTVGLPHGISIQDMTFSWKVLGYTPCSASCLGGIQEAMIQCVRDYDQRIATPVLCMDKVQPDIATTRTCNDHPCPPRWNVSEFGACSKPCGGGVMTREVSCIHEVTRGNTVIVPSSICPSPLPRTEMLCNAVNCPPYWEPAEWGRCSKNCGGGIRTRTLHCKQVSALGQVVELGNGDHHCTSTKPAETKSCNKKACAKVARPSGGGGTGMIADDMEWKEKVTLRVKGRGSVYAGVMLKLRCPSGKGMDKGSLIWMKGHEYLKVQPDRMELIHKSGLLKIKNTTYSDSGIYTCVYNGRPVSNITLMIKPFTGSKEKKQKGRSSVHDSTLYADQQIPWPRMLPSRLTPEEGDKLRLRTLELFDNEVGQDFVNEEQESLHLDLHPSPEEEEEDEDGRRSGGVSWAVGLWTSCDSSECFNWNTALKRRQVSCEYANGSSVEDQKRLCNEEDKPRSQEECYNPQCLGRWHTQAWSYCKTNSCGEVGFKTRILKCVWFGSGRPAGHACHSLPRPTVTKSCRGSPCPTRHHHQQSPNSINFMSKSKIKVKNISSKNITNDFMDYWDLYDQENN